MVTLSMCYKITLASDTLIDFQIKFSISIGETVTHWFTLIALSALRRSDNENMMSLMNLILRKLKDGGEVISQDIDCLHPDLGSTTTNRGAEDSSDRALCEERLYPILAASPPFHLRQFHKYKYVKYVGLKRNFRLGVMGIAKNMVHILKGSGRGEHPRCCQAKGLKVEEKLVHLKMVVKFKVLIEKKKMCSLGLMRFDWWMEFLMVHLEELEMKKLL
nr:sialyltransferase-like protein 1 [Tanacetum cinerariifolium]